MDRHLFCFSRGFGGGLSKTLRAGAFSAVKEGITSGAFVIRALYQISLALVLILTGCSGELETNLFKIDNRNLGSAEGGGSIKSVNLDGFSLYTQNCMSCHKNGGTMSPVARNTTAALLKSKIFPGPTDPKSAMNFLGSILTVAQVEAIATYLADTSDKEAPQVPANLIATSNTFSSVTVSWSTSTDPSDSNQVAGSGIKGYRVFRDGILLDGAVQSNVVSDSSVKEKTEYKYTVQAEDKAGNLSAISQELVVTTPAKPVLADTIKPITPAQLTGTALSETEIEIKWEASTDDGGSLLKEYRIYRGSKLIATVASSLQTFKESQLNESTAYGYEVSAVDGAGNESLKSPILNVTTKKKTPPSVVNLDGVSLYTQNCMSCHKTKGTMPPVARNTTAALLKSKIFPTPTSPKSAMNFLGSILTVAQVEAIATYLADASDKVAPQVPSKLKAASNTFSAVSLSWDASIDPSDTNEVAGSGIKGYKVFRDGVLLNGTVQSNIFSDVSVKEKTTYKYTVQAEDKAGNLSAESLPLVVTTPQKPVVPDTKAPSSPFLVAIVISHKKVNLNWMPSTDDVGVTGYEIYRDGVLLDTRKATDQNYEDSSVSENRTYKYKIIAIDAAKNKAESAEKTVTTFSQAAYGSNLYTAKCQNCHTSGGLRPPVPRNTSAQTITGAINNVNGSMGSLRSLSSDDIAAIAYYLSDASDKTAPSAPGSFAAKASTFSSVSLTWTTATDDGGSGLKGYEVYRNGVLLNINLNAAAVSYSDSGLAEKTTYKYKLLALDNAGNRSQFTQELSVTTPSKPPQPDTQKPTVPGNVTLTATAFDSVRINWSTSSDAGGSGLQKYIVYRGGVKVQEVASTSLQYLDTGLSADTSYSYSLSAVDGAGNESVKSMATSVLTPVEPSTLRPANFFSFRSPLPTSRNIADQAYQVFSPAGSSTDPRIALSQARALYENRCQTCHTGQPGGQAPVGPNQTAAALRAKINSTPAMAGLRGITEAELNAIQYYRSNLYVINTRLRDQISGLGGACHRNDGDCTPQGNNSSQPVWNVVRMGYVMNGCAQILNNPPAINNALSRVGLTASSLANDANIEKVYNLFFPEREADATTVQALKKIHTEAGKANIEPVFSWGLVLLPICESSAGGAL